MTSKLFSFANGRLFRIQATSRQTKRLEVLHRNMSQGACEAYEPSPCEKREYKYFRIAFNNSK